MQVYFRTKPLILLFYIQNRTQRYAFILHKGIKQRETEPTHLIDRNRCRRSPDTERRRVFGYRIEKIVTAQVVQKKESPSEKKEK
jgi:hypothetical protein